MLLKFDIIDTKTSKNIQVKVSKDFDTLKMEEWGNRAKKSGQKIKKLFSGYK